MHNYAKSSSHILEGGEFFANGDRTHGLEGDIAVLAVQLDVVLAVVLDS